MNIFNSIFKIVFFLTLLVTIIINHNSFSADEKLGVPLRLTPKDKVAETATDSVDNRSAISSVTGGFIVNTHNREESSDFFKEFYLVSASNPEVDINWSGDYRTCNEGTTDPGFREGVLRRINYFRAMAGVPADVVFNEEFNAKSQKAALMMSSNDDLSHDPPLTWSCFSDEGAEAAGNANLVLGQAGQEGIQLFIKDSGSGNAFVGHRRWVLHPQTTTMGTGDVPGNDSTFRPAQALWVIDIDTIFAARPETREEFVSWPPPGFVPYQTVFGRWSFSFAGADFTETEVTMSSNSKAVSVDIEPQQQGFGENTIVWIPLRMSDRDDWPKPNADEKFTVNINNVLINGEERNFTYDVTIFDPGSAPTTGKAFSFNCEKSFLPAPANLEKLILESGSNETCTLKLTNLEPGKPVDIASNLRSGYRACIDIEPNNGTVNENGELDITIMAVKAGVDWVSWTVANEEGEFKFDKDAYDTGVAWGMFVEVR